MATSRFNQSFPARIYGLGLVGVLGLAILGGMAGTLLSAVTQGDGVALPGENRRLGALPPLPRSIDAWNAFPREFEAFVNDHFGFRATLISTHTAVSTALLDRLPTDQVIAGKDGWLFYAAENALALFQRTAPLDPDRLAAWQQELTERAGSLGGRGVGYAFAIAPDKHTIYGEYMPDYLHQGRGPSQYDEIVALAQTHTLPVIDLRPNLLAAKPDGLLYMRDDTHWNARGAYVAYHALMTQLGMRPLDLHHGDFDTRPNGPGDLARMALIDRIEQVPTIRPDAFPCSVIEIEQETDPSGRPLLIRTRCDGATGKLMFYRNSFGDDLLPFLAASFGEVVAISGRPSTEELLKAAETERPDVILEERVERHLRFPPAGKMQPPTHKK